MSNESLVSQMLVDLTEAIEKSGDEIAVQGILGGSYGYGAYFKNDVFEMRPFWWGDCECGHDDKSSEWSDAHDHKSDCYQSLRNELCYVEGENGQYWDHKEGHGWNKCSCDEDLCKKMGLSYPAGSAIHCTCGYQEEWMAWLAENPHDVECGFVAPNFKHIATGIEVRWYKYIGRGMELSDDVEKREWRKLFNECFESLGQ